MAATSDSDASRHDMVRVDGGELTMGSSDFYPEERPVHRVTVDPFWIDRHLVTNRDFASFVEATGYVTVAERPLDPALYPGADPDLLHPGGLVFQPTRGPVPLDDFTRWWAYVPGASWRAPMGPGSGIDGQEAHPVVQVAYEDAEAYAAWRGTRLPTEREWEHAARGGLVGAAYCWGDEPYPDGAQLANTWQGQFPWQNLALDGYLGTSPVGAFPPNGYGLLDMAGNVWEWTSDWWRDHHDAAPIAANGAPRSAAPADPGHGHACCGPTRDPYGDAATAAKADDRRPDDGRGTEAPGEHHGRKVIKGGSHLCAPNFCLRFRPAARQPEAVDTSTCHIGFRCAADAPPR